MSRFCVLFLLIAGSAQASEQASHRVTVRVIDTHQVDSDMPPPTDQKLIETERTVEVLTKGTVQAVDTIVYTLIAT